VYQRVCACIRASANCSTSDTLLACARAQIDPETLTRQPPGEPFAWQQYDADNKFAEWQRTPEGQEWANKWEKRVQSLGVEHLLQHGYGLRSSPHSPARGTEELAVVATLVCRVGF
jgi:N-acetyl-anhydromuramyl-L-alanine amidase AmpD